MDVHVHRVVLDHHMRGVYTVHTNEASKNFTEYITYWNERMTWNIVKCSVYTAPASSHAHVFIYRICVWWAPLVQILEKARTHFGLNVNTRIWFCIYTSLLSASIFMTIFTGPIYRIPFVSHPDYCSFFSTTTMTTAPKTPPAAPTAWEGKTKTNWITIPDRMLKVQI